MRRRRSGNGVHIVHPQINSVTPGTPSRAWKKSIWIQAPRIGKKTIFIFSVVAIGILPVPEAPNVDFKGMLSQESKERFDEPNPELLASRYLPILQRQIEQSEDYELSPSKFGSTWVDEKRERIVPKLKIT